MSAFEREKVAGTIIFLILDTNLTISVISNSITATNQIWLQMSPSVLSLLWQIKNLTLHHLLCYHCLCKFKQFSVSSGFLTCHAILPLRSLWLLQEARNNLPCILLFAKVNVARLLLLYKVHWGLCRYHFIHNSNILFKPFIGITISLLLFCSCFANTLFKTKD